MSRFVLSAVLLLVASSCGGFRAVSRADWDRVYVDPANRGPGSKQEVISHDKYEEEIASGTRRTYEPPPGFAPPYLAATDAITMAVGEVYEYRIDETKDADVQVNGATVDVFLTPAKSRDEWKGGTDVTKRESTLFIRATKAGSAVVKLSSGSTTKDIQVTIKP